MHLYVCVCKHTYIYICMHTVCICMYVCVCMCIHIDLFLSLAGQMSQTVGAYGGGMSRP